MAKQRARKYEGDHKERQRQAQRVWRSKNAELHRERVRRAQWKARRRKQVQPRSTISAELDRIRLENERTRLAKKLEKERLKQAKAARAVQRIEEKLQQLEGLKNVCLDQDRPDLVVPSKNNGSVGAPGH